MKIETLPDDIKLYIPGPVEVSDSTYKAIATPMIGHRGSDFVKLYEAVQPSLQKLFSTEDPVYLSTSSAWGVMEGSIRNLVQKKVLNCMCGAFSDKWHDVSKRCGKEAGALQVEWGQPIDPEALRKELSTGEYDCVTFCHNETSTGVMNDLPAMMEVIREFPEVISVVDTVSSFSVLPIEKDNLGIDVMLTGSQKALALPPGLSLISVSKRALDRASKLPDRGYYFDFHEFQKNHEKGMTPSTPVIPLIFALKAKIEEIFVEGVDARYARHEQLNQMVHGWVEKQGFELFPPKSHASKSLTCVSNNREVDIISINKELQQRYHKTINTGYGKIKEVTFRISNMGDETVETISELLDNLDTLMAEIA